MKNLTFIILMAFSTTIFGQAIIIDHHCIDLEEIPTEWIDNAKADLFIGYGHTSHGSQLTSGMDALESQFTDGTYDWSHDGGPGELHLFEGSGGYLELDCGYAGWDTETREYLNDFPDCNVIMWSWCGQVNDVILNTHYLTPMQQLETDYPDVQFVYMTGHLEGLGPDGSLFQANQQIRDFCEENDKILFDFADIEKFDPDAAINYQDYFADDGCNYTPAGGGTANWANDWLDANPDHELTQCSQLCSGCAHSVSLNCVKKGVACWYLWAQLAGWDGPATIIPNEFLNDNNTLSVYPNPATEILNFVLPDGLSQMHIQISSITGKIIHSEEISTNMKTYSFNAAKLTAGIYFVQVAGNGIAYRVKFIR